MGKKLRIVLVLVFAACIGAIIWQLLSPSVPDPIYKGKPLSYWLSGYLPRQITGMDDTLGPTYTEAATAVRELGTNALPHLISILREPDRTLKDRLFAVLAKQHV